MPRFSLQIHYHHFHLHRMRLRGTVPHHSAPRATTNLGVDSAAGNPIMTAAEDLKTGRNRNITFLDANPGYL